MVGVRLHLSRMRTLPLVFCTLAAPPLLAQPSIDLPRLFPHAAYAPGIPQATFDANQNAYLLTLYDLSRVRVVEFRIPLSHPHVQRGLLRVEETTTGVIPIDGGGLYYRTAGVPASGLGRLITPHELAFSATHDPNHDATLLSHGLDSTGAGVLLRYRDRYTAGTTTYTTEKTFSFTLIGSALRITATADAQLRIAADYDYAGFHFGDGDGLPPGAAALHVPYMDMLPVFHAPGLFVTRCLDWYQSHGSETPSTPPLVNGTRFRGETSSATYRNERGDLLAPIHEVAWLVVSDDIRDTFPVIDRPRSEYRLLTAERAVSQNGPGNRYDKARDWVQRAAGCGIDDMLHIKWDWSKWPFNLNDPDYLPAAPAPPFGTIFGSAAEWLSFAQVTAGANWALAPYLAANMMDPGYPNLTLLLPGSAVGSVLLTPNPAYDASVCTRDASGVLKKGWDTNLNLAGTNLAGQGHPVDVASPTSYAARFAAIAAAIRAPNGFPTGGAHIDAQTDLPAWIEIDQQSTSGLARTIAQNLALREQAFQALKDGMQGPLFGENSHWRYRGFESYAAGVLDGTSRKIPIHWSPAQGPPDAQNWDAAVIPDFELGVVLPQSSAWFGMGWEFQYRGSGYPVPQAWSDGWHTTLLSYGHAPFVSTNGDVPNNYWNWRDTLRSLHLTRGISAALRRSPVREIRYVDAAGTEHALAQALALGLDLAHPRLVIRCADGTELKANHAPAPWITSVLSQPWTIPTDGFVGASPGGRLALSAINPASGQRVDYAREPGVLEVIDRRGVAQELNGFPGALLPVPPGLFPPNTDDKQLTIVRDLRRNQVVYATGFLTARRALGPAPSLVALRVVADDTTTLSLGRLRLGLRAIATDSSGNERDVTGLVTWTSSRADRVTVGRFGALTPRDLGDATITATLSPTLSAGLRVEVTPYPVVSQPALLAQRPGVAQVAFTTDSHAPLAAILVERVGGGSATLCFPRPSPNGKHHVVTIPGLQPNVLYDLTPAALNDFQLVGTGASLRILGV